MGSVAPIHLLLMFYVDRVPSDKLSAQSRWTCVSFWSGSIFHAIFMLRPIHPPYAILTLDIEAVMDSEIRVD
jgi:hypothetical protein